MLQDRHDVLDMALEVSAALSASLDLEEVLSTIARRLTEVFDVWECNIWEYRADDDVLIATALWSREPTAADLTWVGQEYPLADRPSYRDIILTGSVMEHHVDDELDETDRAEMEAWGEQSSLSVPLFFRGETIGTLSLVEKRSPRRFLPEEYELLGRLAVPAAVAIHNARMFRHAAEQNRRLAALVEASRAMSSTLQLDELLQTIAHAACEALGSDECAIDAYDQETETLTVLAYYRPIPDDDPTQWVGTTYSTLEYPGDRATLYSGHIKQETVSDPRTESANQASMLKNGEKTILTVPLVEEGEPVGALAFFETEHERHFTAEEREVAWALGEQARIAMRNARLHRRLEEQNLRLSSLLASTRAITSSVVLEDVLETVAETAARALDCQQCQIQEYDAEANTVTVAAMYSTSPDPAAFESLHQTFSLDEDPEDAEIIRNKVTVEQAIADPHVSQSSREALEKYGDKAYLNVPLVFNDEPIGLLVLIETERERRFAQEEAELAQALAEQAAVAIEHARLYSSKEQQAITDGLTGLYNHRYFYERLGQEVARARRYGTPVSLLMIDMDDFKAFNDAHGHVAGDAVLRKVAGILAAELRRDVDIAARYGGEEFAVILPNTPMEIVSETQLSMPLSPRRGRRATEQPAPGNHDGAVTVAERIRRRIAETAFTGGRGPSEALTLSVGIAVFPEKSQDLEDLVRNADAALYKAKRAGKDKVETFG
jgi:GGDEF domain-containing protein